MSHILLIECSARREGSLSRTIGNELVGLLQQRNGPHVVTRRDLVEEPLPFMHDGIVHAIRTRPASLTDEQRTATMLSERLIGELKAADFVVIATPMYNWSVPAALKAWIDQVVRVGITFDHGAQGPVGLLGGKPVVVIMARGGGYSAPERAQLDFQQPYLKLILGVMGLVPTFVRVENTLRGDDAVGAALAAARKAIGELAETLLP